MNHSDVYQIDTSHYGSAACPRCQGRRYEREGQYYRCIACGQLVDAVARPVVEVVKKEGER